MHFIGSSIAWGGRLAFLAGIVAIPWLMGGRNPDGILIVSGLMILSMICTMISWWMLKLNVSIPNVVYPLILLLVYISLQSRPGLFPTREAEFGLPGTYWKNLMKAPADQETLLKPCAVTLSQISISPYESLSELSLAIIALCGGVVACFLFSTWKMRLLLFWITGINGCAMAIFGMYQKTYWNGKIYWIYDVTGNANPFGAFINRNNAAGFLNLSLSCLLGLLVYHFLNASPTGSSLIRTAKDQEKLDIRRNEFFRYIIASLELPVLIAGICFACVLSGLLVTQSRSGVLAGGCGLLISLVIYSRYLRAGRGMLLWMSGMIVVFVTVMLIWLSPDVDIWKRLGSTDIENIKGDSRWLNWKDAVSTLKDHGIWGTGLSTYQFAHKPYQSFNNKYWFYHAENQYLQLAIETGIIGIICLVTLFICWGMRVKKLAHFPAFEAKESVSLLIIAIMLFVCQFLQAFVDFGLYHFGSLLTCSILLFATLSEIKLDDHILNQNELATEKKDSTIQFGNYFLLSVLFVTSIPALIQLRENAESRRYLAEFEIKLKQWEQHPTNDTKRREELERAKEVNSLNPELHLNHALALIEEYSRKQADLVEGTTQSKQLASSLSLLRALAVLAESNKDQLLKEKIASDKNVRDYLLPAFSHLQKARLVNPLDWRVHSWMLILEPLEGVSIEQRRANALHTLRLNPSDPEVCYTVGIVSFQDKNEKLYEQAFRLSLTHSPDRLQDILTLCLNRHRFTHILEKMIPPDPSLHFQISRLNTINSLTTIDQRYAAIKALELLESIPENQRTQKDRELLGEGYFLSGEYTKAKQNLESLLKDIPLSIKGRLILAETFIKTKEEGKAHDIILEGLKFSSDQELSHKLEQIQKQLKTPSGIK